MITPLLKLAKLSKAFRSHWTFRSLRAVESVSLEVFPAETFGFLGHNGAGKTTTIKCIVGLIHPSAGQIFFDGDPIGRATSRHRQQLGYLPEQPYFYDHLTVFETLEFFASLCGVSSRKIKPRIDETLEMVRLTDRRNSSVRALSKGLQQRLGLAQAIINRPRLLLLDEPFSGLDPIGRMEVRELLLELKKQGSTIFLSSHILSDVNDICDRVAIMAHGRLRKIFELGHTSRIFGEAFELSCISNDNLREPTSSTLTLAQTCSVQQTPQGTKQVLRFKDYSSASEALGNLLSAGVQIVSFESIAPSLEEIFVKITEEAGSSTEDLSHS